MALLAATKKTGELRVVGGRVDGRVHLDGGRVVAASVGRADSFVDAVFELLRLSTGKFSFDADKQAADPADPVDIEPLLLEAGARLTEWRGIEAVVPSMDHGVRLVADLGDPHVTLAAEQWRMVVTVAGAPCVHDVADRLGLGEYAACKALKDLVESGVVEVVDPPQAAAPPAPAAEPAKAETAKPDTAKPDTAKPEPEHAAKPEPEAKADTAKPEPEHKPEPKPEPGPAKARIEPERKPDAAVGKVPVPALTTKDQTSPIPPGEEPGGKGKKPAAAATVNPSQAKALVSQLAALGSEKPAKANEPTPEAKAAKDKGEQDAVREAQETEEAKAPAAGAETAPEGGDTDEPLNRGLLLKFLSSVRQ